MIAAVMMVAAMLVGCASAKAGQITTSMNGGSTNQYNYVATAATNGPVTLTCVSASSLSVLTSYSCTGTNLTTQIFRFDTSTDNSHWVTNAWRWSVSGGGTSTVTASTNLNVGPTPFVRVFVENSGAVGVTNLLINGFTKNGI